MPLRDFVKTPLGTVTVAGVLCLVCSLVVSTAAVALKSWQDTNKALDKKKNVLMAAGFGEEIQSSADVDRIFAERIKKDFIDISTGDVLSEEQLVEMGIDPEKYDAKKAANDPEQRIEIADNALPGIANREPVAEVFKVYDGDSLTGYVFPIYGKGLWSTLYGFIALNGDGETVRGITYYEHKETPGLGGEVDNANWKALWPGKEVYGEEGEVELGVVKGKSSDNYGVDGLSGATITSKGVDQMVKYWLGPSAFGQYLAKASET